MRRSAKPLIRFGLSYVAFVSSAWKKCWHDNHSTNQPTKDCHANILQELRSCVKAEVAVLGSPSLIVPMSLWMSNNTELEKHIKFSYFAGQKPPVELLDDCAYAIHV